MPRYSATAENSDAKGHDVAWYYSWPFEYATPRTEHYDSLKSWRKQAITEQQNWKTLQNSCGKEDPVFAKFCKEEGRRYLKLQRACTLMLPWFGQPDREQETIRPKMWPVDLDKELDEISYRLLMIDYVDSDKKNEEQVRETNVRAS